jgi:hypothetical protein
MPVLNDEQVLNVDGLAAIDTAQSLRIRAQGFLASRHWTTTEISYGDQVEPDEEGAIPLWSFSFCLGLDHIHLGEQGWRDDVEALIRFLQEVYSETRREILMEVRYRSRLWYSEHIAFVDDNTPEVDAICTMIKRVTKSRSSA